MKIYFAADTHLGLHTSHNATERERAFVRWLDMAKTDATEIFLLGDIFDFWFEYKYVVPRGYTRLLGKIAEITDSGIPVHFFIGNHDMWTFNYLTDEVGVTLHRTPGEFVLGGKTFFIGHGDGIANGNGDAKYKRLKRIFANHFLQRCFAFLHPWIGMSIAHAWSNHSRLSKGLSETFVDETDYQLNFAKNFLKTRHVDFFVFGHRHVALQRKLEGNCLFTIVGEWIQGREYAVFDGETVRLQTFK